MAKTRMERIANYDEKIAKLQDQRKEELQKQQQADNKAKENRYKKRHKLLEDALPETIGMTEDHYKLFVSRAVANDTVRKIITNIMSHNAKPVNEKQENTTENGEDSTS